MTIAKSASNFTRTLFKKRTTAIAKKASKVGEEATAATPKDSPKQPKLNILKYLFKGLSKEQLAAINESGELPKFLKVYVDNFGKAKIKLNFFNGPQGSHKLPEGMSIERTPFSLTNIVQLNVNQYKPIRTYTGETRYVNAATT